MSQQHQLMEPSDGQLASSALPVCSQSLVASVANQFQSCQVEKFNEFELWSVWRTETDEQARSLCYEIRQIITVDARVHVSAHSDLFRRAPPRRIWERPRWASVFRFVSSR